MFHTSYYKLPNIPPPPIPPQAEDNKVLAFSPKRSAKTTTPKVPQRHTEFNVPVGKHLAKRDVSCWPNYGDPDLWSPKFEEAVLDGKEQIESGKLKAADTIKFFENKASEIAIIRGNERAHHFGVRRKGNITTTLGGNQCYGYALERAVNIPYDDRHFVQKKSDRVKMWEIDFRDRRGKHLFRYGSVQGYIKGENSPIPLTQYIFWQLQGADHQRLESENEFGGRRKAASGDEKETSRWLHPGVEQFPVVLKHIESLVQKAIEGDLTVIPNIHWWYVHLAPVYRGAGGIAEMLTNTLCRLHDVDLPPWRDGVAPSVEVLLEPDEEKFCLNYYQLFAEDQEKLKRLFECNEEQYINNDEYETACEDIDSEIASDSEYESAAEELEPHSKQKVSASDCKSSDNSNFQEADRE
ncbi:MAG: hypothetical protein ACPG5T_05200 [Endozoicomonas sp.]